MERIITSHRHHYRIFISALIALAFLGVMVAMSHRAHAESTAPAANEHIITLHDDGVDRGFITKQSTIRDALKDAGIRLDANDRTEPSLDEKLVASSYQVNIYRARPVVIRDGSAETKIVTSYRTGKQIAKQANITLNDADNVELDPSRDPIADGAAEVMTITRATAFTFIFYGKTETSHTLARTVGEMLKEKNITMGKADGISPSLSTPISEGMTVKLWRDGTQTVTVEEDVAFTTKQIKDADRERGYKDIQTKGENGRRTVTYEINTQNGVEVSRKEINSNVTKEPIEQVEVVGAKNNYSGSVNEWLLALRTCETHSNYTANTGNGFYGAYQFMIGTWDNIARKTGRTDLVGLRPDLANPADQDAMVIANTNMTAGLSTQHPGCYAKLGLSNKPPQ